MKNVIHKLTVQDIYQDYLFINCDKEITRIFQEIGQPNKRQKVKGIFVKKNGETILEMFAIKTVLPYMAEPVEYIDLDKREVERVDMTPTWEGVIELLLHAVESGTEKGKEVAKTEIRGMVKLADQRNAACKIIRGLMEMPDDQMSKNGALDKILIALNS